MSSDRELTVADYEEVLADHRRLVRELDVLLNGAGAAKQASLCDIVGQLQRQKCTPTSKNVALQGLARGLEVYVMTNRDGDAFDLALLIDNLIKERISEAMQPAAPESRDAPMRVQAHVYVVEPLCEEAAEEIERLRAALEQCNEHRDDPHKIIGIVDAALAGMPPYNFKRNADDETDSGI